jgi:hypothetical protein
MRMIKVFKDFSKIKHGCAKGGKMKGILLFFGLMSLWAYLSSP